MSTHYLTESRWTWEGAHDITIAKRFLEDIDRATLAIDAIATIVGNSACEPDRTHGKPLDPHAIHRLMGGVESLCSHIRRTIDDAIEWTEPLSGEKA